MIPNIPRHPHAGLCAGRGGAEGNLATAARIKRESGAKILLATKAWAMPAAFPLLRDVLDGTTASGEYEARMGREEFGKEVHVYAPAYTQAEVESLTGIADHIYFNSPEQIARFLPIVKTQARHRGRHPRQSRLLERDARRRAVRPVRALLALRHRQGRPRPAAVGRHRHLPRACAVRVAARRFGRADPSMSPASSRPTSGA